MINNLYSIFNAIKKFITNNWLIIIMLVLLLFAGISALTIYIIYDNNFLVIFPNEFDQAKRANWGTMGDFFGGILNPIFGFFGLIMLLATLFQSQKELSLTREEIKHSTKALQDQAETLQQQRFEGTFFQLLILHQEIVSSIELFNKDSKHITKGRDCFKVFYDRLEKQFDYITGKEINPEFSKYDFKEGKVSSTKKLLSKDEIVKLEENIETINKAYLNFYQENQAKIGHYFRSLYNIVKFVDNSNIDDKRLYINLLRSQLSVNELNLLFYNCLSDVGNQKFKPLIEEYTFLKSFDSKLLLEEQHMHFYEQSAFN